jgi:hypothetical protein
MDTHMTPNKVIPNNQNADASQQETKQIAKQECASTCERISPQICCTITPEDKEILDTLMKHAFEKKKRAIKLSALIRSLIRLGAKYKDRLEI